MDFSVLGPLQVRAAGRTLPVRRGLPRLLLTYLLLHPGEPVAASLLADRVWNGEPPADAGNAVHRVVFYLRRALGAEEELPLHTTSGGYVLDVPPSAVDSARFTHLVRAAGGDPAQALTSLDEALALWRGDPLADAAGLPWALPYIAELEELHLKARESRLACLLDLGRHIDAVPEAQALAAAHPLRESLRTSLMLALYRCGRQSDALAAAAALRRTLAEELGLDPSAAVLDLERRILLQDPDLAAPPATTTPPERPEAAAPADPPGSTGEAAPSGVPRQAHLRRAVTSLVGRDEQIAAASAAFADAGLLTLTGPGGTGKTRLALALLERRPPAVWFADLSGAPDDDTVASIVAAATGTPTSPGVDVVEAVVAHLRASAGVLVLDTCEHVVQGAAAVAAALLQGCPQVRQLATSRRPLGVSGEVLWPVPPLTLPPVGDDVPADDVRGVASVELFAQRAAAVQPGFRIDDRNAGEVAAICRALDGLPLAIELAAAHVDVLSPARIRRRLDDRFALLVSDARDVVARQRTLRAAISSSVDLLTADERALFTNLAVFAGTFDLEATAAVAPGSTAPGGGEGDHFRLLASLLRQSLIARADPDRYRLLDSLRAYAAEMLAASPEADDVRRRHAAYHVAMAEAGDWQVRTETQEPWLALLREVQPDVRAALRWCLDGNAPELGGRLVGALGWFWTLEGQLAEARSWLDRAQRSAIDDPKIRSRVLLAVGLVAAPLGDLAGARDACAEAAALSRAVGDDVGTGDALITLGVALWALGDLDAAAAAHDEAADRLAADDGTWRRNVAVVLRARTALDRGDADASDRVAASLAAARRSQDAHILGLALTQQARHALREGRGQEAVGPALDALTAYRRIGYREGEAAALTLLARAHLTEGDAVLAADLAEQALGVAAAINHRGALCHVVEVLAGVRAAAGDDDEALTLLEVAAADRRRRGIPDSPVERELTGRLLDTLKGRLGPRAAAATRAAAGMGLDDVVARHRTRTSSTEPSVRSGDPA